MPVAVGAVATTVPLAIAAVPRALARAVAPAITRPITTITRAAAAIAAMTAPGATA